MFFKKRMQWLWLLILLFPNEGYNQLNIKIGYNGGYSSAPAMNGVITQFNNDFVSKYGGKMESPLDEVKLMNGLEIGARYRMNSIGFELTWNSMSDINEVYGNLSSGTKFQSKWYTSLTQYALGIENYIGNFGYGVSLGYRTAKIRSAIDGSKRKKSNIVTESELVSKFYLLYQLPSDVVALAIKPYIEFPLNDIDIRNFDQELFYRIDPSYISPKPINERFMLFGISIVLYNGPQ